MEILSRLTPAETCLIMEGSKATFKDLLKYTLIDLLLKKVLKSEDYEHQSHPSNPIRMINCLETGINFKGYVHKTHEEAFLKPYIISSDLQIMFRHLVKMSYENAGSKKSYIFDNLLINNEASKCFKYGLIERFFGLVSLNDYGKETKKEVVKALDKLEEVLPNLINTNPEAASAILSKINGNIFLLKSFDFELLKNIDDEFSKQVHSQVSDASQGCSGCFVYFDTYSDSFDSGFDAADASGSGCSGASGCSGCSGCGGCGGCS